MPLTPTTPLPPGGDLRLLRRSDLADDGIGDRAVRNLLAVGALHRVRPGVLVRAEDVSDLHAEGRAVVRARALALVSTVAPVVSHLTAAALHGLPLYGDVDRDVHVIASDGRPGRAVGTVRHRGAITESETTWIAGVRCTSLARTIADVARTATRATAVAVADAALRSALFATATAGAHDAMEALRGEAEAISGRSAQHFRRAARVLRFADGRAESVGESVSRVRLVELGFDVPDLQVSVPGPTGQLYFVDFGLRDVRALGEFDGRVKYTTIAAASGRTADAVFDDEKQREDWIRGVTDMPFARWGAQHVRTVEALGSRLAAFGLRPPT